MSKSAAVTAPPIMQATIENITSPHPDIRIIRLRINNGPLSWLAGQFMELSFAGYPPRSYSIANAPHEDTLEFHIRNNNRGGANHYAVTTLKQGDLLTLRGPFGKATLPAHIAGTRPHPLVMIAGGMGISPIKALIEDALHDNDTTPITLYWGAKTTSDLYIAGIFTALEKSHPHFHFNPVIEDQGDGLAHDFSLRHEQHFTGKALYLSGPPDMIAAALPVALQNGALPENIYGDDPKICALHAGLTPSP